MVSSPYVIPIRTATSTAGKPIKIGSVLGAIAITPAGKTAYVARDLSAGTGIRGGVVVPINTATNNTGKPVKVGILPLDIAITP